ncbi:hypothetical protein JS73_07420 [Synergistes jonesii]|uniref:3-oxoacyl-ACP synthase n=2 Tax=Synergistes jonesii TaxID=2754 RepID=A0A073IRG6_9BACT|nr:hypothetical protein EH55_05285 [Synergistes jonesii]OFB62590.1 hypothetical protein JS73_07420 [Synergistes jonesii]OFB63252.1 hypothetical protein JS79_07945 [Synergistes jonesii]OFB64826.1 hypothetical protein JS72_03425 [Synergistes jonesii]OFB67588.1 hypothetical protein JS78_07425 [Synergistes jonesii]
MIKSVFNDIRISAMETAVSTIWEDVDRFKPLMGESTVQKFKKSTGVLGQYVSPEKQTTSDLACAAARKILEEKCIDPNKIGALVFVTQTPDYAKPATACVLQFRLGLPIDSIAFDVNLGCSGFVNGINIAASLMQSSKLKYALLLLGDTAYRDQILNTLYPKDDSGKMLFGDAAVAVLMESNKNAEPISCAYRTDGSRFKSIIHVNSHQRHLKWKEYGSLMDGVGVFNFTINDVPEMIKEFMMDAGTTPDDYDCLVLHQANLYVMKQVAKRTGFPMEKMLVSIDEFANTSSASIPTALTKYYGKEAGNRIIRPLMCGFGVGLSWGIVDAKINVSDILPLLQTDESFDDGLVSPSEKEN